MQHIRIHQQYTRCHVTAVPGHQCMGCTNLEVQGWVLSRTGAHFGESQWEALSLMHAAVQQAYIFLSFLQRNKGQVHLKLVALNTSALGSALLLSAASVLLGLMLPSGLFCSKCAHWLRASRKLLWPTLSLPKDCLLYA
eukprot:scaffold202139_cov15-Tisochrysis_lutea.AAC.1